MKMNQFLTIFAQRLPFAHKVSKLVHNIGEILKKLSKSKKLMFPSLILDPDHVKTEATECPLMV